MNGGNGSSVTSVTTWPTTVSFRPAHTVSRHRVFRMDGGRSTSISTRSRKMRSCAGMGRCSSNERTFDVFPEPFIAITLGPPDIESILGVFEDFQSHMNAGAGPHEDHVWWDVERQLMAFLTEPRDGTV